MFAMVPGGGAHAVTVKRWASYRPTGFALTARFRERHTDLARKPSLNGE